MIYLKTLKVSNYCGYKQNDFVFFDKDIPKLFNIFYGPNGVGKSNLLYAINIISNIYRLSNKQNNNVMFRKLIHNENYDPGYQLFELEQVLKLEAIFTDGKKDYKVTVNTNLKDENGEKDTTCVELNELKELYSERREFALYVDADSPMQTNVFQIRADCKDIFEKFSSEVYDFKVSLPENKKVKSSEKDDAITFYTDMVILKPNNIQTHYRSMSAGEKKVATMLRILFNDLYNVEDTPNIIIIDNIEMHVYFERHLRLMEQLEEYFPDKQFFATTHSSDIVNGMDKKYLYNLKEYVYGKD